MLVYGQMVWWILGICLRLGFAVVCSNYIREPILVDTCDVFPYIHRAQLPTLRQSCSWFQFQLSRNENEKRNDTTGAKTRKIATKSEIHKHNSRDVPIRPVRTAVGPQTTNQAVQPETPYNFIHVLLCTDPYWWGFLNLYSCSTIRASVINWIPWQIEM